MVSQKQASENWTEFLMVQQDRKLCLLIGCGLFYAKLVRWTVKCFISSHLYELSTNIIPVLLVRHFFQVQYPRSNRDKLKSHLSRAFLNEHSLYWIYLSSKFTVIINNFLSSNSQGKCHRTAYDQLL